MCDYSGYLGMKILQRERKEVQEMIRFRYELTYNPFIYLFNILNNN